jgi:hypothetical protein
MVVGARLPKILKKYGIFRGIVGNLMEEAGSSVLIRQDFFAREVSHGTSVLVWAGPDFAGVVWSKAVCCNRGKERDSVSPDQQKDW